MGTVGMEGVVWVQWGWRGWYGYSGDGGGGVGTVGMEGIPIAVGNESNKVQNPLCIIAFWRHMATELTHL